MIERTCAEVITSPRAGSKEYFPLSGAAAGWPACPKRAPAHTRRLTASPSETRARGGLFGVKEGVISQLEGGAHGGIILPGESGVHRGIKLEFSHQIVFLCQGQMI